MDRNANVYSQFIPYSQILSLFFKFPNKVDGPNQTRQLELALSL